MAKNINEATVEDLAQLPQMSRTRAETIVHWRDQHGSFTSIEELSNIPGIGEKMATQVGEFFVIGDAEADDDEGTATTSAEDDNEGGEVEASSASGDDEGEQGEGADQPAPRQARRTSSSRRRNSSGEGGTDKEGHRLNKDGSIDKRQFNKAPSEEGGPGNTADEELSDEEKQSARG